MLWSHSFRTRHPSLENKDTPNRGKQKNSPCHVIIDVLKKKHTHTTKMILDDVRENVKSCIKEGHLEL